MSVDKGSPISTPRKLKFEQLRADYELFLQTFEKPTWLYRHLQRKSQLSPFMLNRNLSYLRSHHDKKIKEKQQDKRKEFKLNYLLHKVPSSYKPQAIPTSYKTEAIPSSFKNEAEINSCDDNLKNYLNMSFSGFFHGPGFAEDIFLTNDPNVQRLYKDDFVAVSIHLIQVYHKRKKDKQDAPMDVHLLGSCKAPWNPRSQLLLPCSSVQLSVPPTAFTEGGRAIKTHILSITVGIIVPKRVKRKPGRKKKVSLTKDAENIEEPPSKRHKSENLNESFIDEASEDAELKTVETVLASFSAELIVYDRHRNCLLTDADYELLLQENIDITENHKNNSWESKFKSKLGPFAAFSFGPTIKFSLRWESKASIRITPAYKALSSPYADTPQPLANSLTLNKIPSSNIAEKDLQQPRVFYQFIYNNSTRQQTEAKEGSYCPWCGLNCKRLYGLLKHLKCCHTRFSFLYTPLKKGRHRIDVCMNENFENSLDLDGIKDMGFINVDEAPLKRKPQTEILVARPCKLIEDLTEFTEPDIEEIDGVAPMKGHDRVYYHSNNNEKLGHFNEFDYNSDDQAPDWLEDKIQDMIEEFTDVNDGEKVLMKLWNLHLLKKNYIADFSVAYGCVTFVEEYGEYILKNKMKRNFLLHLNNLIEFQVIPQSAAVQTMDCLSSFEKKMLVEE